MATSMTTEEREVQAHQEGTTRRGLFGRGASVAGAAALLAGCGPFRGEGEVPQPSGAPVALRYAMPWAADAIKLTEDRLVPSFKVRYPRVSDVKVEGGPTPEVETRLRAQLAAGTPPDAVYLSFPHFRYAEAKDFADLTKFVAKDRKFNLKDFYPRVTDYYRIPKGGLWALPHNYATEALFYNKSLLAAGGVKPPTDDWTWDDLLANARRLHKVGPDGKPEVWGVDVRLVRIDHVLWDYGGGFLDDTGTKATIGQPGSIQALEYLGDLVTKHKVQPFGADLQGVQGGTATLFLTGKLALQFRPEWWVVRASKEGGLDYDVALVPKGPKGRFNFFFPGGVSVTTASKQQEAAYEFAKWFVGDDEVIQVLIEDRGDSPTAKIARNEWFWKTKLTRPEHRTLFLKNPDFAKTPYFLMPKGSELRDLVQPALNDVWEGKRAAREVALELQPKVDAILRS